MNLSSRSLKTVDTSSGANGTWLGFHGDFGCRPRGTIWNFIYRNWHWLGSEEGLRKCFVWKWLRCILTHICKNSSSIPGGVRAPVGHYSWRVHFRKWNRGLCSRTPIVCACIKVYVPDQHERIGSTYVSKRCFLWGKLQFVMTSFCFRGVGIFRIS